MNLEYMKVSVYYVFFTKLQKQMNFSTIFKFFEMQLYIIFSIQMAPF